MSFTIAVRSRDTDSESISLRLPIILKVVTQPTASENPDKEIRSISHIRGVVWVTETVCPQQTRQGEGLPAEQGQRL